LIKLCQNIVGSGFLRHTPTSRCCCYGNHAAGSKPMFVLPLDAMHKRDLLLLLLLLLLNKKIMSGVSLRTNCQDTLQSY